VRDGLRGASPRVTELPEESADGKAVHTGRGPTAKGSRFPHGKDGKGRAMRRAKTSGPCIHDRGTQPKAEERWKLESRMRRKCPVRFGGGPGEKAETSDLACGLPYPASSSR
jgi:hypothetical protein